jgi:hypothetical protein
MNQNPAQKTNVIKEELDLWKKNILNTLNDSIFKNEVLFIVNNYWLNIYEKFISNLDDKELELKKFEEEFKNNDYTNNKVLDSLEKFVIPIEKLPKVFILNKSAWDHIHNISKDLNSLMTTGYCSNNLISLKVYNNINCFFFLDKASQIRQGYLEIIKMEDDNKILIDLQNKGIFKFINKDINDINNEPLLIKDEKYKLYITENCEPEEKIMEIFKKRFIQFKKNNKERLKEKFKPNDSILKIKEEMKKSKLITKVITAFKMINAFRKIIEINKEKEIEIDSTNIKNEKHRKYNLNNENLNSQDFFPKISANNLYFPDQLN